jgi:hypothetical protein
MSTIYLEIPNSLQARLELIAKESGLSIPELLIDAAEKMAQIDALEKIKASARLRDTRSGSERVLAAVPDVPPGPEDMIQ